MGATAIAAAAVAPSSPVAPPDRWLLRRCRCRSPPPLPPPTAIGASSASSTSPGAGTVASAAVPRIDNGSPPISDDQLPSPMLLPPLPPPTTSCAPTLVLCRPVVRRPLASRHPPSPLSSSRPPPARLAPPSPPPLLLLSCRLLPAHRVATSPPPVAVSSFSPLPLSSSRPLPALACRQREDIATTIVDTTSSSPTNKGVHHREESHGVCHSRGTSCLFWHEERCWDRPPPTVPPPRRHRRRSPRGQRGGGDRKAILAKAIDLPCAGQHCLPGGGELCAATIRSPTAPLPPAPLAPRRSRANHVPGESSPLAMKRSIRTASASSGSGVRRHLLLYNSANRPTHQFCSLRD